MQLLIITLSCALLVILSVYGVDGSRIPVSALISPTRTRHENKHPDTHRNTGHLFVKSKAGLGNIKIRGGKVSELDDIEQFERVLSEVNGKHNIVVVDFTASWCMPCKVISPVFRTLSESEEFADVIFLKIDVDNVPAMAEKYGVRSMPTFVFFRDNKEIARFSGASVEKLTETIRSLMQT